MLCFFCIYDILCLKKDSRKEKIEMSFIEEIKNRAKQQIKTIILPEATDIRILKAAQIVNKEKYARTVTTEKAGPCWSGF